MVDVSDALLLEVAGIGASLLGFFVVGVFFYVQRGMFPQAAEHAQRYLQAATASVIALYGMLLVLTLALVALPTAWVGFLHLGLSAMLLWSVAQTSVAIRRLHDALRIRVMSQLGMWSATASIIGVPWVLGGPDPSRSHLALACALIGVLAFISSASLVLSAFDISALEASVRTGQDREPIPMPVVATHRPGGNGKGRDSVDPPEMPIRKNADKGGRSDEKRSGTR